MLLSRLIERKNKWLFERAVSSIRKTPAVRLGSLPLTVVSMVHHRDVSSYLLAAKSFLWHIPARRVLLVADPTLNEEDRSVIRQHIPGIGIINADDSRDPRAPKGGTWERLITIADQASNSYVIQLDADTVTVGELEEVRCCVDRNRAFLLATDQTVKITSCLEASLTARSRLTSDEHIQIFAEANLDALGSRWSYARACSGFAGFPTGSFDRGDLVEVCAAMFSRIGQKWADWGSEQVTSNLVCASQPDALVLPHPKYCNAHYATDRTEFLHFIGYTRFRSGDYAKRASETFRFLSSSPDQLQKVA